MRPSEQKRRKRRRRTLIVLLAVIAAAAGYFAWQQFDGDLTLFNNKTISSADGTFSIKVPFTWKQSTVSSPDGVLAAENRSGTMYAMVSVDKNEVAEDTNTDDYIEEYISRIAENSSNPEMRIVSVNPEPRKMGRNKGHYFELDTVSDGVSLHIWHFVFSDGTSYVHINVAGANNSRYSSDNVAKNILSSMKIRTS